ncbi:glycosyltransferase family 4 protein [Paenibacillus thermoaerophilus]|uniref:Glycosyltransferase family 4 protein n=1 Tax=Paenibacillus thermoaerophilus TaxID=1215385 RepID=A0ABW2V677_9BACL|nr:glycosyltransferase family 4 protein [Paenibacillus thermoaerophilus]TMV16164.1 glycosyltransferase family 4 protein [Paenibacillus thermoaerophilus]
MFRVAYLDHTAKWSGGEIALFNLLTNLDKSVQPLVILAEEGTLADKLRERGIEVRIIWLDERTRYRNRNNVDFALLLSGINVFRHGLKLARILKEEQVVCVHTNSLKSAFYGGVAAKLARLPLVWHIRDQIASPYLRPVVARFIRLLAKMIPNGIIANSHSTMSTLDLPKRRSRHALVAYSSYDGPIGAREEKHNMERFAVLLVGRLDEWKGQHVLLEAAKSFLGDPRVQFWIAGDALFGNTVYKEKLERKIREESLTNVKLLGHVDPVRSVLQKADLLIHTSIIPEPFGQVIVEGMANGLPVIATDMGGPREIVLNGETGMLIEPGDPGALARAIRWMLEHPEERRRMGKLAMERVRDHFRIETTVKKILEFYPNIIVNKKAH